MAGLVFLLFVIAVLAIIVVYKLGWKGASVAFAALLTGLYAGGQQLVEAVSVFLASIF